MKWLALFGACLLNLLSSSALGQTSDYDTRLRQAEEFVNSSSRYMHHSRIVKGMKGYGLTVMSGTKIERFDVEVVSVMKNFSPHHDVILCNLSGLGLEKTGVIEGMSGSPVFLTDPADGKEKIIGAVAYGWKLQKEPICGVQPITQMLALEGVPLPGSTTEPASSPAPAGSTSAKVASSPKVLDEAYANLYLDPRKLDFASLGIPRDLLKPKENNEASLRPLSTPLMVSGSERALEQAKAIFEGTGLSPMQSGGVGGVAATEAAANVKLEPGSSLSVQLVGGDADWSAVGTVTDVIGNYVLGFGHAFLSRGHVEMPMGPAYIHAVVPSLTASFKLGSTLRVDGALSDDQETGVGGTLGKKVETIPLTLHVREKGDETTYHYELLRHPQLTPVLAAMIVDESLSANRQLPEHHWLAYNVQIDFDHLGKFQSANCSCDDGGLSVISDIGRPLAAMLRTELGEPVMPKSIDVTVSVQSVRHTLDIVSVDLEKNTYKPGEMIRGKVTLKPFRAEKIAQDFSMTVPEDLADGTYTLTACEAVEAVAQLRHEMPQRFAPRTVEQLFEAIQEIVSFRTTSIYLRLPLRQSGLAVHKNELNNIPGSLGEILSQADPNESKSYRMSLVQEQPVDMVVNGSADVRFLVSKNPQNEVCK